MRTKRSRLTFEDESSARVSKRASYTRMSHLEFEQQDMEVNAGSTEGASSSTRQSGDDTRHRVNVSSAWTNWETRHESATSDHSNQGPSLSGSTSENSSSNRQGRGSAKPWKEWNNGEKKIIGWNSMCQPIEPNCEKLASQLGYHARQGWLFPLSMKCWSEASIDTLEQIWKNVKANRNAPDGFKPICFEKIGKSWRSFKNRVKERYYKALETDMERRAQAPSRVEPDQWPELVTYWGEENAKRVAAQNTTNRQNQTAYPGTGRTPFSVIIDKMNKNDLPTDKVSVWKETRKKNGSYCIEDGAAGKEETLTRRLNELAPEEKNNPEARDRIFSEVIGLDGHGHVLCRGGGIRPASVRSKFSSYIYESQIHELRQEAQEREACHQREVKEREMRYQQEIQEREAHHQQELEQAKAEMKMEVLEVKKELILMMRGAGIIIPEHTARNY